MRTPSLPTLALMLGTALLTSISWLWVPQAAALADPSPSADEATVSPARAASLPDDAARQSRVTPIVEVVRKVGPTVVNLYSDVSFLTRGLFGGARPAQAGSLGAGVIVHESGLVVTNAHVLTGNISSSSIRKTEVTVHYRPHWDGPDSGETRSYEARVVGIDPDQDLALLKILSDERFPAARLGTSSDLMIGETVVAVGNPYGREGSVTHGIISATNRDLASPTGAEYSDLIQTDAPLNAGNSGGPLFNILGELIGINQAVGTDRQLGKADGQGLAIPVDRVRGLLENRNDLLYLRGLYLGSEVEEDARGLRIKSVDRGSPSDQSGLKVGDLILAVGGRPVPDKTALCLEIYALDNSAAVPFTVRRGGESLEIRVQPIAIVDAVQNRLGVEFDPEIAGGGLAIRRVFDGPARRIGLQKYDVLLRLGDDELHSVKDLFLVLQSIPPGQTANIRVQRQYQQLEGKIPLL